MEQSKRHSFTMGKRCNRDVPRKRTSKDSVVTLLYKHMNGEKRSARKAFPHSRSYTPRKLRQYELTLEKKGIDGDDLIDHEIFYDTVTGTCYGYQPKLQCKQPSKKKSRDAVDGGTSRAGGSRSKNSVSPGGMSGFSVQPSSSYDTYSRLRDKDEEEGSDADEPDGVLDSVKEGLEQVFDNSERHSIGISLLSKIFGTGQATSAEGFDEDRDSRPFFTYWISIVQIIVFITVIATYGIAPYGLGTRTRSKEVLKTTQTIEKVTATELTNMWVGPRMEDLVHLGARYSMCMRNDTNLVKKMKDDRKVIRDSACCVQNDGSGCLQTTEDDCSAFISTFFKWTEASPGGRDVLRTSGSVCGQDPAYCDKPDYEWPDDISEWPICDKDNDEAIASDDYHMKCELLGRPCCIGIQGKCIMTTPEDCKFQRGYYHDEATLCSQVRCMEDVCGMLPFADPDTPDQFYRLFSVMFLHAGILDLVITVAIQLIFMRDLEKLISSWRVVIIYIGSNICGSLASATFLPYYVESGPSGATFGIIAALYLEVLRFERRIKTAQIWKVLLKMGASLVILFIIGLLLPQVDNFSHMFGFLFGLIISYSLRPYKRVCNYTLSTWVLVIVGVSCGIVAVVLFVIFIIIFYEATQRNCDTCLNLNCIPFTDTYCDSMKENIRD